MKISIDDDVCLANGMTPSEVLIVLVLKLGENIPELMETMKVKQILIEDPEGKVVITSRWNEVTETIMLDSDDNKPSVDRLDKLVTKLQESFPEGKKDGTAQYWRGNKREISLRLKKFFKLYGEVYTDDQILNAAKTYVTGFNGRTSYMRVLKYFIWKDERKTMEDGEVKVVEVSDLANYIENANSKETLSDEWTSILN